MARDRTVDNEIVVTLFIALRRYLDVRGALAATRWVKVVADRQRRVWN